MSYLKKIMLVFAIFLIGKNVYATEYTLDSSWEFASYSVINDGKAKLYLGNNSNKKNYIVAVSAGHGTSGASSLSTYCHPDKSPKIISGSTSAGSIWCTAVSSGMVFSGGTSEAEVNLKVAILFKEELLKEGFDVLMLRENDDARLDNIARTVLANNIADIHIAIHFDSTSTDKGAFYTSVPDDASYRSMYPVSKMWEKHHLLGTYLIGGLREEQIKIYNDGTMPMDLVQTSFSTIPSIDIELGDKKSDLSSDHLRLLAKGLTKGVAKYYASIYPPTQDNEENREETSKATSSSSSFSSRPILYLLPVLFALFLLIYIIGKKIKAK